MKLFLKGERCHTEKCAIEKPSPGLFSITSDGAYTSFYYLPPSSQSIGALGLPPALNGSTYGPATNSGPTLTFSELFAVGPSGSVTTYPYQQASADRKSTRLNSSH